MVVRYALTPELDTCVIAFADEASFEVQLEVSVRTLVTRNSLLGIFFSRLLDDGAVFDAEVVEVAFQPFRVLPSKIRLKPKASKSFGFVVGLAWARYIPVRKIMRGATFMMGVCCLFRVLRLGVSSPIQCFELKECRKHCMKNETQKW